MEKSGSDVEDTGTMNQHVHVYTRTEVPTRKRTIPLQNEHDGMGICAKHSNFIQSGNDS